MMRRFWNAIHGEVNGIHSAAYVLAIASLASSLLALLRDRVFAGMFGAGPELDVYYAAFRIPDLLFVAAGALVSVYILIPEIVKRNRDEQHSYIDSIVAGFSMCIIPISIVLGIFAPHILFALFPEHFQRGFGDELVLLTRIILLQPIFLGLSNIFAALTQSQGRYILYALSPLLYNTCIILGALFLYPYFGIIGLGIGVVFGAILHACVQIPSIIERGFLARLPRVSDWKEVWHTAHQSLPRACALSLGQLTLIGLSAIAVAFSPGSLSIFTFALNLQAVPLGIIGASYSVAAFPTLAAALARGERESYVLHVVNAMRYIIFWSLPMIALGVVLRAHAIRAILGSGRFDWTDTRLTAAVFAILMLALLSQGIMLLLIRAYYAAGNVRVPVFSAIIGAIATLIVALLGTQLRAVEFLMNAGESIMRVEGLAGTEVLILAIAWTLGTFVSAFVLMTHFSLTNRSFLPRLFKVFGQSFLAASGALVASYFSLVLVGDLESASALTTVLLKGFVGGASGVIVASLVYWVLGSRELLEVAAAMEGRLAPLGFARKYDVPFAVSAEEPTQSTP